MKKIENERNFFKKNRKINTCMQQQLGLCNNLITAKGDHPDGTSI